MRYLYGAADEKFVKTTRAVGPPRCLKAVVAPKTFEAHSIIRGKAHFNRNDVPIVFKVSPDSLLDIAAKVVDALPLPSVYQWTNVDVCRWIRQYGYPHYQRTFRENLIHGRSLLLLDASALIAMNIKNMEDIRRIAYGIRCLFFFELTRFSRSISLAPNYHYELYKLFRVKNGPRYESTRRTDLWRQMQLIRERKPYLSHWELLERWLAFEPDPLYPELFGPPNRRYQLYRCRKQFPDEKPLPLPLPSGRNITCDCMPPCTCFWTEARDMRPPSRLEVLSSLPAPEPEPQRTAKCMCMPPCTCHWQPKKFMPSSVLTCLVSAFPLKYGPLHYTRKSIVRMNLPQGPLFKKASIF